MTQRLVQKQDERQDYETPPELVAELAEEFGPFEVDLAATEANKKAPRCFTPEQDALAQDWTGLVGWLNPPYGVATKAFVKKAANAKGAVITCLLPARTDTQWFHLNIWNQNRDEVYPNVRVLRFLQGRPKFLIDGKPVLDPKTGKAASGKFPSMVVVFDNRRPALCPAHGVIHYGGCPKDSGEPFGPADCANLASGDFDRSLVGTPLLYCGAGHIHSESQWQAVGNLEAKE